MGKREKFKDIFPGLFRSTSATNLSSTFQAPPANLSAPARTSMSTSRAYVPVLDPAAATLPASSTARAGPATAEHTVAPLTGPSPTATPTAPPHMGINQLAQ